MSKITYTNKVDLYEDTSIADINKVKASDMNEIKTVVNNNDDTTTNNTNAIGTLTDLTTTNKDNLVNAINELSVDYIVEQGTSGIWSYRKWNSGLAECWTTSTLNTTGTFWANIVGGHGFYVNYNFPSGLFSSKPVISGNGRTGTGGGFVFCSGSSTDVTAYVIGNQDENNLTLEIFAKGKWK